MAEYCASSPGNPVRMMLVYVLAHPYAVAVSPKFAIKMFGRTPASATASWTAASETRASSLIHCAFSLAHRCAKPS